MMVLRSLAYPVLAALLVTSFPVEAIASDKVDKKAIRAADKQIKLAEKEFGKRLKPLKSSLASQQQLLQDALDFQKQATAKLKEYEKSKKWYQKLVDDDKTDQLKLLKDGADKLVKQKRAEVQRLQTSIKIAERARDSTIAFEEQKKLKADPARVAKAVAERTQKIEELNGDYYTAVAQKKAGEISFQKKLTALDKMIEESEKAGLDDVADAIRSDQKIIEGVYRQWETGQDSAIESARRALDAGYRENREDGMGPTQWTNNKPANDPSFIDASAVEASVRTANRVAGNALANTQQDWSATAWVEDYGNTALIDPNTGEWDPLGVATRYGYYAKGAGRAVKDSVVDLVVLAVDLGGTVAQATEEAIGQSNYLGRDKIEKAYEAGNFVVDLADADSEAAKKRREQMSSALSGALDSGVRQAEMARDINKAMEMFGFGVTTVVDPVFNSKGLTNAGKADAASDLAMVDKAQDATKAERAAGKLEDARKTDPLHRLDADELAGRGDGTYNTKADEYAQTMRDAGLEPQRTVKVGDKIFHLSQPFENQGRTWIIALEETADGKVIPRQMYLSGEHGVWRAAPGLSGDAILKGPRGPDGKFANEGITDVDAALQGTLDNMRTDFGVKNVPDREGTRLTTQALEYADGIDEIPQALDTDLAKATRPLPRDADGKLPEGMRPDFVNGIESVTTIDNHPQYGTIERVVVKSRDGKTSWIVNRAPDGKTWVGGVQDNTAGLTGLGTRNSAYDVSDLTTQPLTKSPDGKKYIPADGWENDVNKYMAYEWGRHSPTAQRVGPPAPPEGPSLDVMIGADGVPVLVDANDVALPLGKKLGEGSGTAVYEVPGHPDLVIKISRPGSNPRLDDFGAAAIREVDPDGTVIQVAETYGRHRIEDGKIPGALDGDLLNDGVVSITEKVPKSWDKARIREDGTIADMSRGQKEAYRNAMAALNEKGYVLLDNHPGNYAFKKVPGTEDQWVVVIVDAETMVPFKSPDAAKRFQRKLDDPESYATPDIPMDEGHWQVAGVDVGRAVHQEGLAKEFNGEVDWARWRRETGSKYTSLGATAAATDPSVVKFNPMNGLKNKDIALPENYVPTRLPDDPPPGIQVGESPRAQRLTPEQQKAAAERDKKLDDYEAGLAKRRARLEEQAKDPSNLPTRSSIGQLTARGIHEAPEEEDDGKTEEEDLLIVVGEGILFDAIPAAFFSIGRTVFGEPDGIVDPDEESYVSIDSGWEFEMESAISLAGTGVHTQQDLAGGTTTRERGPVKPPPQKQPPPPPPAEKPPEIVIGQPQPPQEEKPKEKTESPEKPPEQQPPEQQPPEETGPGEVRIGTGYGGTIHFSGFSIACGVFEIDSDDSDRVASATVTASGAGDQQDYEIGLHGGYQFRVEHEIYSYGTYDFELKEVRNKEGDTMKILGNRFSSYKVGSEEKPCW